MTVKERASCINTIKLLQRLAFNVHGVMDVIDAENCDKIIKMLEADAQQWIPCSERLPEEDDYKSCIECLDGAVWYFTENGTMGLGYYYKSVKEWSTTDDLKTDGKVVAWMPLPEPWKGEQE